MPIIKGLDAGAVQTQSTATEVFCKSIEGGVESIRHGFACTSFDAAPIKFFLPKIVEKIIARISWHESKTAPVAKNIFGVIGGRVG